MEYQFRSIEHWPGPKTNAGVRRSRWTFKASWSDTVDLLERELRFLGAKNVVIQAFVPADQIRLDGMLRAGATPSEPGVILSFDSKHGPLSYPCDSCLFWKHNVRSIALALEALRSVDRYGVTRRAEQYKGWAKLPAPEREFGSIDEAKEFIELILGNVDWSHPHVVIRCAKAKAHPDISGGSQAMFKKVCKAAEMLNLE